jgi:multiple sugar transport system permease protein
VRAWSFLLVAVASVLVWSYVPLLRGLVMAFQDYRILGGSAFVGLRNFVEVFSNQDFYIYLWQTCVYVTLSLVLGFAAPIALAVLLSEIPRGKVIMRVIYYLPNITTGLVTMFLWKQLLFNTTEEGVLNRVLMATPGWVYYVVPLALGLSILAASVATVRAGNYYAGGGMVLVGAGFCVATALIAPVREPLRWLQDPLLAMPSLIIPGIWAGTGAGCLVYLAALKGIPDEHYEAADMDGAGTVTKFWNITIPSIKALIIINFVGAFIGAFQAAQNIFVMTAGGPANKTMTIGLDIWYNSFLFLKFGYATSEAWILGSLLIGFTLLQLQMLNKVEFKKAAE